MIGALGYCIVGVVLTLLLHLTELKEASRPSRWTFLVLLFVSALLFVYVTGNGEVPRPAVGLENLLQRLNPVR